MANLFANIAQLGTLPELELCFAMVAGNPSRLLKRNETIEIGGPATFIVLAAASPALAVAEIARPVWGMKDGRVSFEHPAPKIRAPFVS
jgi:cytosine deaminase